MIEEIKDGRKIEMATFQYRVMGPVTDHNYLCAVCRNDPAVLDCPTGVLHPCWVCQQRGYSLIKKTPWFARLLGRVPNTHAKGEK